MENFNIEDQALEEMIYEFAQSESSPGWDYINNQCSHSGFNQIMKTLIIPLMRKAMAEGFEMADCKIADFPPKKTPVYSILRLIGMIPRDFMYKAAPYVEKIAKIFSDNGQVQDAKLLRQSIKMMKGEEVPMATMDHIQTVEE